MNNSISLRQILSDFTRGDSHDRASIAYSVGHPEVNKKELLMLPYVGGDARIISILNQDAYSRHLYLSHQNHIRRLITKVLTCNPQQSALLLDTVGYKNETTSTGFTLNLSVLRDAAQFEKQYGHLSYQMQPDEQGAHCPVIPELPPMMKLPVTETNNEKITLLRNLSGTLRAAAAMGDMKRVLGVDVNSNQCREYRDESETDFLTAAFSVLSILRRVTHQNVISCMRDDVPQGGIGVLAIAPHLVSSREHSYRPSVEHISTALPGTGITVVELPRFKSLSQRLTRALFGDE